eukprot:Clim_evm41s240 gene=Clim_evmTU41s240
MTAKGATVTNPNMTKSAGSTGRPAIATSKTSAHSHSKVPMQSSNLRKTTVVTPYYRKYRTVGLCLAARERSDDLLLRYISAKAPNPTELAGEWAGMLPYDRRSDVRVFWQETDQGYWLGRAFVPGAGTNPTHGSGYNIWGRAGQIERRERFDWEIAPSAVDAKPALIMRYDRYLNGSSAIGRVDELRVLENGVFVGIYQSRIALPPFTRVASSTSVEGKGQASAGPMSRFEVFLLGGPVSMMCPGPDGTSDNGTGAAEASTSSAGEPELATWTSSLIDPHLATIRLCRIVTTPFLTRRVLTAFLAWVAGWKTDSGIIPPATLMRGPQPESMGDRVTRKALAWSISMAPGWFKRLCHGAGESRTSTVLESDGFADSQQSFPGLDEDQRFLLGVMTVLKPIDKLLESPMPSNAELRRVLRRVGEQAAGFSIADATVTPTTVAGGAGPRVAWLYTPNCLLDGDGKHKDQVRGLVVYFHGGGWVQGDLLGFDPFCRQLAVSAKVKVLSIDYRLAPEDVYPAALDDCTAAFLDAVARAESDFGCDPDRVAVAGDSAGGHLAATVCHRLVQDTVTTTDKIRSTVLEDAKGSTKLSMLMDDNKRKGLTMKPAAQLLLYPVTDCYDWFPSRLENYPGLTLDEMVRMEDTYFPPDVDRKHQSVSPLHAPSFEGQPPAVVLTAGFDILRDEGVAYADRLRAAGVKVEHLHEAGAVHGCCLQLVAYRRTVEEIGQALNMLLSNAGKVY